MHFGMPYLHLDLNQAFNTVQTTVKFVIDETNNHVLPELIKPIVNPKNTPSLRKKKH